MGGSFIHRSADNNNFNTHYSLTEQLLQKEHFSSSLPVLEPACGKSCITKILNGLFLKVDQFDINHPVSLHRKDFYTENKKYPYIITNPPYGKETDKFVMKAKEICTVKFAFLLRTNYLSGQARYKAGAYKWLKNIYVFSRMPDLRALIRRDGKYPSAGIVYAWLVWEIGWNEAPRFYTIDNQKYILKAGE
ncbi:MAG: hypothetical protein E3J23_08550 [Candidatus Stahlbacteria bacterium]|nr:MAG: hypothetical protein E3J23_08550 [Candidatus Stahlbacteria bacterium]